MKRQAPVDSKTYYKATRLKYHGSLTKTHTVLKQKNEIREKVQI